VSGGIPIVKLSGAGNDFVALGPDGIRTLGDDPVPWIRAVCRRGLSVGADGVLLVEPAGDDRVRVRFHNPDGSPAFCGNGTRCAARFARRAGFAGESMVLETAAGDVPARLLADGSVSLDLPVPEDLGEQTLDERGARLTGRWVVAGVPHFVVFVPDVSVAPLDLWGPLVRRHPSFGEPGTNLDLAARHGSGALSIRTFERGVEGETLSCGSGAVAAAYAARLEDGTAELEVTPASGVPLRVGFDHGVTRLTGDARVIFEVTLDTEATSGFGGGP
jgi:diaminopimelate epimerase